MTFPLVILSICYVFFGAQAYAKEEPAWVEAAGESFLGEIDTPKEVMERAKRNAESSAVEKAVGVFIKANTLVSNSQISEDLIYASVRGRIIKSEIVKSGWDNKDRNLYKVEIKALVDPIYPARGEDFSIRLSLSKANLKDGEPVEIFYQSSIDSYVYLFCIAADGSVTLLFPNSIKKDNRIQANKPCVFPSPNSSISLKAKLLPDFKGEIAEEKIKVIATKNKEEILSLGFQEGIFKVYDERHTGMISDLVKKLNKMEPNDWAEMTAIYYIRR